MMDEATRKEVLALDAHDGTGLDGVMETNSFSCRFDDGATGDNYLCLFPEVSRVNHACRPNANAKFSSKTLLMEIRALRDIIPGEEISIAYGQVDLQYEERQKLYTQNWGFACTCELCAASKDAIAESDKRRMRFKQLHDMLASLTAETYDARRVLNWEKEIIEISEREGFEALVAEDMERIAYVYAGLGAHLEAISWAQKAEENILQWKVGPGETSNDLKRLKELLEQWGRA